MTSPRHARGPAPDLVRLEDGRQALLRPLRPEDADLYEDFDAFLTDEDRRLRFFTPGRLTAGQIWAFTHFDRADAQAVVGLDPWDGAMLGVARLHRIADGAGEFAVLVRSDLKGLGLGRALMERLLADAPALGVRHVMGLILRENVGMLAFARELGFRLRADPDDLGLVRAELELDAAPPSPARPALGLAS